MKFSIIDISSSSISLLVADVVGGEEEVVFRDRASLTLMHYLDGRSLSRRGIQKLADAVSVMKDKCVSLGADVLFLISTAALRAIENFEEVHAAILGHTGVPVNFIDAETEAYCGYVANRHYGKGAVLVDIGGASIEICDLGEDDPAGRHCLGFGVLTLHDKFVRKIQPDEDEAKEIARYVGRKFDKAEIPGKGSYGKVVLAGATNLALYSVYAEYAGIKEEDGERTMRGKKFKKLVKHLLSGSARSRLILDTAPEKLYSVGIAAIVDKALLKRLGAESIVVSEAGVKEGYLRLICEGKLRGAFYDFAKDECFAVAEEPAPAEKAPAAASAETVAEGGAEETLAPKKRGRKPAAAKAAEAVTETAESAAETPAAPAPKKRGRKPAAAKAAEAAKEAAEPVAETPAAPAPKKRGRKPAAAKAAEAATETAGESASVSAEAGATEKATDTDGGAGAASGE